MTGKLTSLFFRVIRPLFAALIGLTLVQAFTKQTQPVYAPDPVVILHIPAVNQS